MITHDTDIVSTLRWAIAERIGQDRFELWFGSGTQLVPQQGRVFVEVPNQFTLDWLRNHFRADIESAVSDVIQGDTVVEFRLNPELGAQPPSSDPSRQPVQPNCPGSSSAAHRPTPRSSPDTLGRRRYASLESFVVGDCNRVAHTSADVAARRLGAVTPLFLYGPTGVGKTHLLEGICSSVRSSPENRRVVYLSAEQFTSYFLEALQGKGLPSFRRRYREVDLLIVDDVQFLAGKRATQAELQHTMETLLRQGRQLAFASDRPPTQLTELGGELVTRFCGGLVCQLHTPDFDTRLRILQEWTARRELAVPEEVLQLIASQLPDDVRLMQGALNRVQATSQALGQPITGTLARQALADLVICHRRAFALGDVERVVCGMFKLDEQTLKSKCRNRSVSHPRMLAMWLARKHTRAALSEIGDYFGGRSHTTVVSAHKTVERWINDGAAVQLPDQDCHVRETVRQLVAGLRAG